MTVENHDQKGATLSQPDVRKTFVEPVISHPVDVLEATTFFQVVESGGTGLWDGVEQTRRPTEE